LKKPRIDLTNYQELDKIHERLDYIIPPIDSRYISFKRVHSPNLSSIFVRFVTPNLLTKILEHMTNEDFVINKVRNQSHIPSVSELYITLAVSIRIQGLHNVPQQNTRHNRPLREAITEASEHFKTLVPGKKLPGITRLSKLVSLPLLNSDYAEDISHNFQNLVFTIGSRCAGDEKLFHFTGDTVDIRLVPSKPDRIGLWFYELAAPLSNNSQYLLHIRMAYSKEGLPVSQMVKKWTDIMNKYTGHDAMLIFDSYYMDNTSKIILEESRVKYLASVNICRFKVIQEFLEPKVTQKGEWIAIHEPSSGHSIVHYWSPNKDLGKMWVMGNACIRTWSQAAGTTVPLFTDYGKYFNTCDQFNRSLHDRSWPHKKGGYKRFGAQGAQHNFILTCILMNTFNAQFDINQMVREDFDFCRLCLELADELFINA
jgi:hypothetical protein